MEAEFMFDRLTASKYANRLCLFFLQYQMSSKSKKVWLTICLDLSNTKKTKGACYKQAQNSRTDTFAMALDFINYGSTYYYSSCSKVWLQLVSVQLAQTGWPFSLLVLEAGLLLLHQACLSSLFNMSRLAYYLYQMMIEARQVAAKQTVYRPTKNYVPCFPSYYFVVSITPKVSLQKSK